MLALLASLATPAALAGDLLIEAPPRAEIFVDGQRLSPEPDGRTRISPWLTDGDHLVEVFDRWGQPRHRGWVEVPATARVSLVADRERLVQVELAHVYAAPRVVSHAPDCSCGRCPLPEALAVDPIDGIRIAPHLAPQPVIVVHQRPARGPEVMPAARFNHLALAVNDEPFGDDKLDLIRAAMDDHAFTIDQVGRLMDTMTFESEKVEVARLLRPRVADPENAWALNSHLTFSSDKREVQALYV